ncbi:MAG TPA: aldo/keto reductase [Baekduia sp.]|nr:aldo/keto reductase [Baekduia sp.]
MDNRTLGPLTVGAMAELVAEGKVRVERLAADRGVTPAQLALAWVLAQWEGVVPIPGTKRRARLEENVGALEVQLGDGELAEIAAALPPASGDRYPAAMMATLDR